MTTANAIHAGIRDEINLNPKVYVFAFTDFDSDALQNLDLRNVLGGGLGYRLIRSKNTQLDVFGGASFNQEYFSSYLTSNPLRHRLKFWYLPRRATVPKCWSASP